MSVVAVLIVFFVTCYCIGFDKQYDKSSTDHSKWTSDIGNKMTYTQYSKGGKVRERMMMSSGKKLQRGLFGDYVYKNGTKAFNIYEEQLKAMNNASYRLAKEKGWDFYPYFYDHQSMCSLDPWSKSTYSSWWSWPCKEMETGCLFVFLKHREFSNKPWEHDDLSMDKKYIIIDRTWINTYYDYKIHYVSKPIRMNAPKECHLYFKDIQEVAKEAYSEGLKLRV